MVPKTHAKMGTKFRSKNGTTWPFLQVALITFDKTGATFGCENGAPKNVRNRYPFLQKKKRPKFYRRATTKSFFAEESEATFALRWSRYLRSEARRKTRRFSGLI